MDSISNSQQDIPAPPPPSPVLVPEPRRTLITLPLPNENRRLAYEEPPIKVRKTAITVRDVQNLNVNNFVRLYNCINQIHDDRVTTPINLGRIVNDTMDFPNVREACHYTKLNEVILLESLQQSKCINVSWSITLC